ncbi:ATP-binding cassette domain-containing protein [Allokutzneria sp. A3M-2-11 16]|uniref:amino acid ABC transporter ATP-binding/permease protein n=1 Tax=Allokutzneria sp. A3M-2-11 16 TaxID=2962043 RepID=UPI0020B66D4D|nr:ATP-binding cassette domain-containing protein [Allokutzneria sp. A3M-2-11 16]MCP3801641.1 ATP-binding cassette domain-containing protein [Allokutzneria sp. A3M-2-11 16]
MKSLTVAAGVAGEICGVGLVVAAAWLITRAAEQPPISALGLAIVAVRGFAIFRGVFRYAERLTGHDVALREVADRRVEVYESLVHQDDSDADALKRMVSDVDSTQDRLLRVRFPVTIALISAAAAITVCILVQPEAGAVVAAGIAIAATAIPGATALAARRMSKRKADAHAELIARCLDLVDGARELAAAGATDAALAKADQQTKAVHRLERRAAQIDSIAKATAVLLQGLTAAAALSTTDNEISAAVLAFTTLAAFELVMPLVDAAQQHHPHAKVHKGQNRHVRATLAPGATAVIGASGAGKTTLLATLAEEHPEARALTHDAHLFRTSVRANLMLAKPDATEPQLHEALRQAALRDVVDELPDGLETVVGEGGHGLSGGQRQRLLLARALLADAPVLLLDEPTEGLDQELADAVLDAVLAARRGRITVVVTHETRLERFDRVVELDGGRVVYEGEPRCRNDPASCSSGCTSSPRSAG